MISNIISLKYSKTKKCSQYKTLILMYRDIEGKQDKKYIFKEAKRIN